MRWFATVCVALALALSTADAVAFAGEGDAAMAEALFLRGREALERGDLNDACARFEESQRLEPAPGTLLNLSECEERRGRLAHAWQHLRRALDVLPPSDERVEYAEERLRSLEPRVPKLAIRLDGAAPTSARVRRDGVELGAGSLGVELPVDAGRHVVDVVAIGRPTRAYVVELAEGETKAIVVAPNADVPATRPPQRRLRTVGFVLGGLGIGSLGVGAVSGFLALDRNQTANDHCSATDCAPEGIDASREGQTFATLSTVTIIGGVAMLATGAILVWMSRSSQ